MFKNRTKLAYLVIAVSTLVATFTFYLWQVAKSPNLNVDGKSTFVLYLPKNATYQTVLDTLHKHKLITDEVSFGLVTKQYGYRDHVKMGRYEIPPNSGNKDIVSKLNRGAQDPVKLTFNNIRTKDDLIKKMGSRMMFKSSDLLNKLNNDSVCTKYGFTPETIMCMFLPDTYYIYWNTSADDFIIRMNKEYKKFWTEERLEKAQAS